MHCDNRPTHLSAAPQSTAVWPDSESRCLLHTPVGHCTPCPISSAILDINIVASQRLRHLYFSLTLTFLMYLQRLPWIHQNPSLCSNSMARLLDFDTIWTLTQFGLWHNLSPVSSQGAICILSCTHKNTAKQRIGFWWTPGSYSWFKSTLLPISFKSWRTPCHEWRTVEHCNNNYHYNERSAIMNIIFGSQLL